MVHPFRPQDPAIRPTPPVGTWSLGTWTERVRPIIARAAALSHSRPARQALHICLIVLGLCVQGAMILTAAYLVDLSLSLMELWTDLARKHLELTL
jgi:hypothetical protein